MSGPVVVRNNASAAQKSEVEETTNSSVQSITLCSPRDVRRHVETVLRAGRVPFVQSSPGMGKSSIMRDIANEWNLELIDHRTSTSSPEDFNGLPRFNEDDTASFHPFADIFPTEGRELPEGKDGWLIFLDEINSAPKSVQAASYKLVLDRMVGQHRLHSNVLIAAAGNLGTDKAIVNSLSTAMKSRLIHLEMAIDHVQWLEDVAFKHKYDPRITAYLNYKPSKLMSFDPDSEEATFPCPRTWEFVNDLLNAGTIPDGPITDDNVALFAGTIGMGTAVDFLQFTKVFASMVNIKDIVADPKGCPVPNDSQTRYAVTCHLMDTVDDSNFGDIVTYLDRLDMTFRVLFFRAVLVRYPELRQHPSFGKAMVKISRYING